MYEVVRLGSARPEVASVTADLARIRVTHLLVLEATDPEILDTLESAIRLARTQMRICLADTIPQEGTSS